jgi:KRAB domain-containing zinc finger protein
MVSVLHRCSQCEREFKNIDGLFTHMYECHTSNHECPVCYVKLISQSALYEHLQLKHTVGDNKFNCCYCDMSYERQHSLELHINTHFDKTPFKCDQCPRQFRQKGSLTTHLKTHVVDKVHVCVTCNTKFKSVSAIVAHVVQRHNHQFACVHCALHFDTASERDIHTATTHYKRILHTCPYCCETIPRRCDPCAHIAKHTHTQMKCHYCPYTFATRSEMDAHINGHINKHNCAVCNKSFMRMDTLRAHMTIHSGIKPFKCQLCQSTFSQRGSLLNHNNNTDCVETFLDL